MTLTSVLWQDNIPPCLELKKNQQNLYDGTISYNSSCLLKVDISASVSLIN